MQQDSAIISEKKISHKPTKRRKTRKVVAVKKVTDIEQDLLTRKRQALFIQVFFSTSNNISQTCETIGINRWTYYNWLKNDSDFKMRIEDSIEKLKDYAESMVIRAMADDWRAAVAWLKIHAKDRGWKPDIALAAEDAAPTEELIIRHIYDRIPKKHVKQIESQEIKKENVRIHSDT